LPYFGNSYDQPGHGTHTYLQEFLKRITDKINSAYLRIKRNEKEINNVSPEELNNLIEISEKWLKELKD
jgi:hypothetical protein